MWMEGGELKIDNSECTRCMHCINVMPRALRPGLQTGATILMGAKAPILDGAQLATMIVPFIEMTPPADGEVSGGFEEIKEYIEKCWDWWMEEGKNRERIGESIQRIGLPKFLKIMEMDPTAPACQGAAFQSVRFLVLRGSPRWFRT